uniref:Mortality factor 4-like protein 1 n=1 Tax=Phallusia mammillata TaxID=59560 RepID=A0A6F9DKC3_9ASCI|nr:mortality factor 4-like protein 1 [Phallusia mammillata]
MAPKAVKFSDGERVLCFHGPLMYEAKCMKSEIRDGSKSFYMIHYNGWNKHWDEWVPETRVLKYNDVNLQKQKDLLKQHGKDKTKRGKMAKFVKPDKEKTSQEQVKKAEAPPILGEPKKKKSRIDPSVESEDAYIAKVEVNIQIPSELKPILVDDWDLVTRQKRVCKLPTTDTVDSILDMYANANSETTEKRSTMSEFTAGVKEYFNVMLGSQLLYRCERQQYNEILDQHPELTASQIYGFTHLLRFFVRVGPILSYTNLNDKNMSNLLKHMHEFLAYLETNVSSFFNVNEYQSLTDHKKAIS